MCVCVCLFVLFFIFYLQMCLLSVLCGSPVYKCMNRTILSMCLCVSVCVYVCACVCLCVRVRVYVCNGDQHEGCHRIGAQHHSDTSSFQLMLANVNRNKMLPNDLNGRKVPVPLAQRHRHGGKTLPGVQYMMNTHTHQTHTHTHSQHTTIALTERSECRSQNPLF